MPLGIYPPLDARLPMGLNYLHIPSVRNTPVDEHPAKAAEQQFSMVEAGVYLRREGLVLPLVGIMVFLNGKLDTSPRSEVRTAVIRKIAPVGHRQAQYIVVVSSWRPARSEEALNVNSPVFERAKVGKVVTIEMRQGRFDFPWVANVFPE